MRSSSAMMKSVRNELVGLAVLVLAQVDGDDAAGRASWPQAQRDLLDEATLGGQDQEVNVFVGADPRTCDVSSGWKAAGWRRASGVTTFGDLVGLGAARPSRLVKKSSQLCVVVTKKCSTRATGAAHAPAAALLRAWLSDAGALGEAVAVMVTTTSSSGMRSSIGGTPRRRGG